ncbi:hypothetical protein [Microvirga sp. KLBC 81]|uniref:hypothetical protein n=1 Tax=Microvirga sp. KLBC 81 TaxID=1862707 RepID=UPI00197BE411|nr:hypothetical protein [Microvirga sp. KLBC 81]
MPKAVAQSSSGKDPCRHAVQLTYDSYRFNDMVQRVPAIPLWIPQIGYATGLVILVAFADEFIHVLRGGEPCYEKPTQEAVPKAVWTAEERGWKTAQEKTKWYTEQMASKGMKVQPPGPDLKAGLLKIGEQPTQDWLKKAGSDGQAIIDSYKKAVM